MLWQAAFPRFYEHATHDGVFIMPQLDDFLAFLQQHGDGATAEERLFPPGYDDGFCLWPYVQDLFIVDFFLTV